MPKPLVAVPSDVRHFDNYKWHATPDTYLSAIIRVADLTPVIVPSFGDEVDLTSILDAVDGVLLTGSKSNVHPGLYGTTPEPRYEPYDEERDATSLPLIRMALERGIPLLAICRGQQELNVALGGELATEIQERDGILDHRAPVSEDMDERFAIRKSAHMEAGSCLTDILGAPTVKINSLHRQAIETLAPGLDIDATADDGTIEAVSVRDAKAFAIGVQWHPEYWAENDAPSRNLFEAFGNAVREHAKARSAR